jgi:hypothetical protein
MVLTTADILKIMAPPPSTIYDYDALTIYLDGYDRISVDDACDLLAGPNLEVWKGYNGSYSRVPTEEVETMIRDSKRDQESFCHTFLRKKLGFTPARYAEEKEKLEAIEPGSPVGIYQHGRQLVIVVDGY